MKKLNLNENFISRIWGNSGFYTHLQTLEGFPVEVIDYGRKNSDSGADYKDAIVKINGVTYSGDIEIHRTAKDWYSHSHKGDANYNKVILHVVFWESDDDKKYKTLVSKSREVYTVILSKFLNKSIHLIWRDLINNPSPQFKLPCNPANKDVYSEVKTQWIYDLSIKRLKYRTGRLFGRLNEFEGRTKKTVWESLLFEYSIEALGFSKNKEPFLKLGTLLDLSVLKKLNLTRSEVDSVIYGTAGFLKDNDTKDDYISTLRKNWDKLSEEIHSETMSKTEWTFFRLRPLNFPTIRLAYASAFCYEILNNDLFRKIILALESEPKGLGQILNLFSDIEVSAYWQNNYNFGKPRKPSESVIGKDRIKEIIVNTIYPLAYLYAEEFGRESLKLKINEYITKMPAGSGNSVISAMEKQLYVEAKSVSDEQGLIHLHNLYCMKGRCDDCRIGRTLFVKSSVNDYLSIILY